MEEWIEIIPELSRKRWHKKLGADQSAKQNLLNELRIGAYLAKKGFWVEYDRKIGSRTPDWTILKEGQPQMLVEVVTLHLHEKGSTSEKLQTAITTSQELFRPASILECEILNESKAHTAIQNLETIQNEVNNWLSNGGRIELDLPKFGLCFKLLSTKSPRNTTKVTFLSPLQFRPDRFLSQITEKVTKYRPLVDEFQLPFVLACLADSFNLIEDEDLRTILFGQQIDFIGARQDRHLAAISYCRMDGLFYRYSKELSGLLWATFDDGGEILPYISPVAQNKLAPNFLS